jgi:hypothetical protein
MLERLKTEPNRVAEDMTLSRRRAPRAARQAELGSTRVG